MTRLEFADSVTSVNVQINKDRVELDELLDVFTEFLTDAGYDIGEGRAVLIEV